MADPINLEGVREARKYARSARSRGPTTPGNGELPPCPVAALGHRGGAYYFLDVHGQERSLSARQLGARMDLSGLFSGDTRWLTRAFPRKVVIKETTEAGVVGTEKIIGYQTAQAGEWLMLACGQAGIFGDHITIRRPGIWQAPDGGPIVHCGDVVICGKQMKPAGWRLGDVVYAADSATPRPGSPCGVEVGRLLLSDMNTLWSWREPGGSILALGMVGAGMLGAAARWRPNGFIVGPPGCGKTKLLKLLHACAPVSHYTNDTTKEGISQAVNRKAMPIFIDEASDRIDQHGAQNLMDLVLAATGDGGAKALRGTSDGRGRSVEVLGVIVMASVAPPDMQAQHQARFTMLELQAPKAGADNAAEMAATIAQAAVDAPRLWGRMLDAWPRWRRALDGFRAALGDVGCAPREMDQVGALLASWWVLTEDGEVDAASARDGVAAVTHYARRAEEVAESDGSQQAVQHLLSCRVQRNHTTDMVPIGELLEKAWRSNVSMEDSDDTAMLHLTRHGIRAVRSDQLVDRWNRPVPRMGKGDGAWFSCSSSPLINLFRSTSWEGSRWRFALLGLDSARAGKGTVRIGSVPCRAIWVGRGCLIPPDPPD